jgi:hypothetical protein
MRERLTKPMSGKACSANFACFGFSEVGLAELGVLGSPPRIHREFIAVSFYGGMRNAAEARKEIRWIRQGTAS